MRVLAAAPAAADVGLRPLEVPAEHRGAPLQGLPWYPAGDGGGAVVLGENPVFEGVPVMEDAPMAEGDVPVALLSHGLGGNVRGLGWLAAGLAERGVVVAAVDHPGS